MKNVTKSSNRHVTFSFRRSHVFELLHAAMRWRCPCHPSRVEIHNLRAMLLTHKKLDGQGRSGWRNETGSWKPLQLSVSRQQNYEGHPNNVFHSTYEEDKHDVWLQNSQHFWHWEFRQCPSQSKQSYGGVPNVSPPSRILHPP
jgi:hypothetical protein